jgi:hypothetical protein
MKIFTISVFAAMVAAGAASAAQQTLTDVEYLRASRCAGLSKTLASADADQLSAVMKAERGVRADYIVGRAGLEYEKARKEAKKDSRRETLTEELKGPCSAFLGGQATLAKQ